MNSASHIWSQLVAARVKRILCESSGVNFRLTPGFFRTSPHVSPVADFASHHFTGLNNGHSLWSLMSSSRKTVSEPRHGQVDLDILCQKGTRDHGTQSDGFRLIGTGNLGEDSLEE